LAEAFGICETERVPLSCALAQKLQAVVLLKGKFTIVSSPCGKAVFVLAGSPALATAGSGDVLTGIIGSLLAAGVSPFDAAVCGASLHGRAGEIAGIGSVADDFPLALQKLLKEF
jgi:NAD(P)H-hydrate epimerase